MKQKNLFIAVLAVLVLVAAAGTFVYKKQQAGQATQPTAQNLAVLVRSDSPTFGNPNAPVHIVEFFDPACGTCRDFYPLVKAMMAANPDKIRLSMRYAPFHPGSDAVVKVLEASRKQGKFEATLEALFASQDSWVKNHQANVQLIGPAVATLGMNLEKLQLDTLAPEVANIIARDMQDANTMGVTMTPEYFVNGKPLPQFGFAELQGLVNEALANAK
jgi:protein-disulfide isomerase